jgi:hypothetical protein
MRNSKGHWTRRAKWDGPRCDLDHIISRLHPRLVQEFRQLHERARAQPSHLALPESRRSAVTTPRLRPHCTLAGFDKQRAGRRERRRCSQALPEPVLRATGPRFSLAFRGVPPAWRRAVGELGDHVILLGDDTRHSSCSGAPTSTGITNFSDPCPETGDRMACQPARTSRYLT